MAQLSRELANDSNRPHAQRFKFASSVVSLMLASMITPQAPKGSQPRAKENLGFNENSHPFNTDQTITSALPSHGQSDQEFRNQCQINFRSIAVSHTLGQYA
ncbi:hypothetical protein VTL71DRAFT_6996 [Oculimacula yallundae]|uniref:Uncharacterized protein n=1 Tax=Oculimacula yallundae TaxID=86028 RepID=A0ABR4BVF2_9HELO